MKSRTWKEEGKRAAGRAAKPEPAKKVRGPAPQQASEAACGPEGWEALAWALVLPAAAECTVSAWLPEMSWGELEVKTALLNVSGALLEGLLAAWEDGLAPPRGSLGAALKSLAAVGRGSFLAAYTSWAGMVAYGGVLAHRHRCWAAGCLYIAACVACGLLAHAAGGRLAATAAAKGGRQPHPSAVTRARLALLSAIALFLAASCARLELEPPASGSELPVSLGFLDREGNRLLVAMACAVAGAAAGNSLGGVVDAALGAEGGAMAPGTLACNVVFAAAGLALPLATLRWARFKDSVLLQSFAGSFCGAASAFAGHCSDSHAHRRSSGVWRAALNIGLNLLGAVLVCRLAYEVEHLLEHAPLIDRNADGLVEAAELAAFYNLTAAL